MKFNLRGIALAYVIRKDDEPVKIIFHDIAYNVDPEDCRINAAPLTGSGFKRYNVKVHKFLESLTQGTEAWKCIKKSKGGTYDIKALRGHYTCSAEGERHNNIKKAYLKELYSTQNRINEAYRNLEEHNQTGFQE